MVEDTLFTLCGEELNVDGTAPVVCLLVFLAVVVGKETNRCIVQVFVVGQDREDGSRHLSWVEDVRLGRAHGRQPAVAEYLRTNGCSLGDADGACVLRAGGLGFATVLGIADDSTFRGTFWQTQLKVDGGVACDDTTCFAEYGSAENLIAVANVTAVGLARGWRQLVAPLVSTVGFASVSYIGSGHLGYLFQFVNSLVTLKQIEIAVLARLQTETGVQALLFLVTVDEDIALGRYFLVGQLPGLSNLVLAADFVVFQVNGGICGVVEFHPRVGKLFHVVHDALYVRLHQFVDYQILRLCAQRSSEDG